MKKLTISLITLGVLATSSFALTTQEVEQQIQEIQKLPLNQRVEKMNELKQELRSLNKQEREEIIKNIAREHHIKDTAEEKIHNKENKFKEHKKHWNIKANHQEMKNYKDMDNKEIIEHEDMDHSEMINHEQHFNHENDRAERNDKAERNNRNDKNDKNERNR